MDIRLILGKIFLDNSCDFFKFLKNLSVGSCYVSLKEPGAWESTSDTLL